MDLVESGRTLRRRWILTSFLFLLTLFAAGVAWVKIPGPYQAESMIVLYPSKQAAKINGNNPLMSFGGSLNVAGDIVLREVSAPTSVAALAAKGYSSSFTIADDPNTTGPILDVTVTGSNQAQVENTLRGVTAAVRLHPGQLPATEPDHQRGRLHRYHTQAPGQQEGQEHCDHPGARPGADFRHPADRGRGDRQAAR